jgi:hypothetical protein
MRRLLLLLAFEVRLVRTAIPLHAVAIIQPSVLLLLMGWVFLTPTFEMWVVQPDDAPGEAVVEAMSRVRSPELPYIAPVLVEAGADVGPRQLIEVGLVDGRATAVQTFPLIDSNIVKNLRNRLTAALVVLWDDALGGRAVGVRERPWLPKDLPFVLFFGLAALPMGAFISPAMTGAFLTARDFEEGSVRGSSGSR